LKQLAFLLSGNSVREPEQDRSLASQIIVGYSVLFHPTYLADADFLPEIEDIINPPQGDDRVLAVPESIFRSADPLVQKELKRPGTTLLLIEPELSITGPTAVAAKHGLTDSPQDLLFEFYAAGYHYLGLQILLRRLSHAEKIEEQLIWAEFSQAAEAFRIGDYENARNALHAAFDVMHGNRQSAYPATINWLDLLLLPNDCDAEAAAHRWSQGVKLNVVATPQQIELLGPDKIGDLKNRLAADDVEILGGRMTDRPFSFLDSQSRAWEISQSYKQLKKLLDREVDTFAGRSGSLAADLPQLLMKHGVRYALHAAFDGSRFAMLRGPKIHWSATDGSIIETLARPPRWANDRSAGLLLFADLAELLLNERAPTTILVHPAGDDALWYQLLIAGQKIASVFGKFETLTEFFLHVMMPEGPTITRPDEYAAANDAWQISQPISRWRDHHRRRHRFDSRCSLLALARLAAPHLTVPVDETIALESAIEQHQGDPSADLDNQIARWEDSVARCWCQALGQTPNGQPGYLIVNPSSFPRRLGIESKEQLQNPTIDQTVRACESLGSGSAFLVDLPGWSYAWIPVQGQATSAPEKLEPLASGRRLKNTQIEIEIDKKTGGIRGIWSLRDRHSRLSQQLVHSAGSEMIAREINVLQAGNLFGEIASNGIIRDRDSKREWARYEQIIRVWRGRPVAQIDISLQKTAELTGDPAQNYIACRWTWPDEKTIVLPSSGTTMASHLDASLEATSFIELREQHLTTNIITAGLVRTIRQHRQFADTLLLAPGESATRFTFWIGLDLPNPFRFAQAELWPPIVVPFAGPPPRGPVGSIAAFHSETAHATSLVPIDSPQTGIQLRLAETMGKAGRFRLDLFQRPRSVLLTNFLNETMYDLYREETQVAVDMSALELQQLVVLLETLPATS
jgi:hypothetical protein